MKQDTYYAKLKKLRSRSKDKTIDLNFEIPLDPQKFYEDFGLLTHPRTNEAVPKLAPYQYQIWQDSFSFKYRLTVKSQKVGITTSSLIEDFQKAITTCRGKEILIIGQNLSHAREHLYTLRKMIRASKKYRTFLIYKQTESMFRDEITKATVLYIRNPDDLFKPTRIIALGPKEGTSWSWKDVKHIHMSDIAASDQVEDSGLFGAAFSRLANTGGTLHIETPPRGQRGMVWEIYRGSKEAGGAGSVEARFHIREVPAESAIDAGLITQEFLDGERERLGTLYSQYYECDFLNPSNTWYDKDLFRFNDSLELRS